MLFANLIDGRQFRFRGGDTTVYVKVSSDHYRKASAGIHGCCLPITSCEFGQFEEVDEVRQITPLPPSPPSYNPPGSISNARITARNGGVQHKFIASIGGCSANYR